jgi:hypothetical protein
MLINIDTESGRRFPEEPFSLRHSLSGHELLSLDALAGLAARLDSDRVEFNSGRLRACCGMACGWS